MVLAYHVIFTAYGFWLPNDPRGSWSDFVWAWELWRFGDATKTESRRSVAHVAHDGERRKAAKAALLHPPVHFGKDQVQAIGRGFEDAIRTGGYDVRACSIMPEHVHMVVGRHSQYHIERIAQHLKGRASFFLAKEQLHPFQEQEGRRGRRVSPWSESFWQVYLNADTDIARAVAYVENNPVKEGLERQRWAFVRSRQEHEARPKGRG